MIPIRRFVGLRTASRIQLPPVSASRSRQSYATRTPPPPPFQTVETCPSPTCRCAAMPEFPDGLDIDQKSNLNGVISGYAEQVLICTGKDDWTSKIEDENSGDNLAADLKELFGRGGKYTDPFHNVSVLNASMPSTPSPREGLQSSSAYLFPSFKYIPHLPRVSFEHVDALAKAYILPEKLHSAHDGLSPIHRDRLTRSEAYQNLLVGVQDVQDILVLICGHGGRDARCGIIGPVLRDEFEAKLASQGFDVLQGPVQVGNDGLQKIEGGETNTERKPSARVGLISHIGGHKFAGNVIVYIPPTMKTATGEKHPLAGHGIWYGRVEPQNVEGLVAETVMKGNVVAEKFRGGVDSQRRILRV